MTVPISTRSKHCPPNSRTRRIFSPKRRRICVLYTHDENKNKVRFHVYESLLSTYYYLYNVGIYPNRICQQPLWRLVPIYLQCTQSPRVSNYDE